MRKSRTLFLGLFAACPLLFAVGCGQQYDGFGRHSLNQLKEQTGDYKSSNPLSLSPIAQGVKRYVSEEKRNYPVLKEQLSDYGQNQKNDVEELKTTTKRYMATQ